MKRLQLKGLSTYFLLAFIAMPCAAGMTAKTQKTLDDCAKELASKAGGWCEMRVSDTTPSISAVWPDKQRMGKAWGNTGATSILIAWNGAGFDAKNHTFYFYGGGHGDYAGNEVYAFDLKKGLWERLTEPSPLTHYHHRKGADRVCEIPDIRSVPFPAHTYAGIIYINGQLLVNASAKGTIACLPKGQPAPAGTLLDQGGTYAFDISKRQWRKVSDTGYSSPRYVIVNGQLLIGDGDRLHYADLTTEGLKIYQQFSSHPDSGDGIAYFDTHRNLIWELTEAYLWSKDPKLGLTQTKTVMPAPHGKSMQLNNAGELISWSGHSLIASYSPEKDQWRVYDWKNEGGPQDGDNRVYSKWQYLPDYDLFVGISKHTTGVWVYKHPKDIAWKTLAGNSPQAFIDHAQAGTQVKIPPGTYSRGFTINKPLTVDMSGVELLQPIGGKGYVITQGGPITVENFDIRHPPGCGTNCAAFRLEKNPVVTLRNGIIANQENGILSGNDGGDVTLKNIRIIDTGGGATFGQQHGIYIGESDRLVADNIEVLSHHRGGHLIKSRAHLNTITNSRIDGQNSRHSRILDFPCGGNITIENSILIQSPHADNQDLFAIAPESCGKDQQSRVVMKNNQITAQRHSALWANGKYHIDWQLFGNRITGVSPKPWPKTAPDWRITWDMDGNQIHE